MVRVIKGFRAVTEETLAVRATERINILPRVPCQVDRDFKLLLAMTVFVILAKGLLPVFHCHLKSEDKPHAYEAGEVCLSHYHT